MNEEQKYRLTSDGFRSQYKGIIVTANQFIELYEKDGWVEKVTTKKVYRWQHSGVEIAQNDGFSNVYSYKVYTCIYTIDIQTFGALLAAGLIIESEEVV
jgi:hypothetical protein